MYLKLMEVRFIVFSSSNLLAILYFSLGQRILAGS